MSFSEEEKKKALQLYDETGSISKVIQKLGYPSKQNMYTSPFDDYFDTRADLKPYRLQECSQFNDCPWTICGYVPTKPIRSKIKEGFPASYRTF